ncbi:MAG TPA: exodeoxyribonuclease VII small subunit [Anaerolineales bacterium]|jgi:exodeoxyribonuclease VII small subunit
MSPTSSRNSGANPKKVEEMTYEAAFTELETIVAALEGESRPLDESLNLYERGQALAAHCATLLEKAELKVRQLGVDTSAGAEGQA